MARSSQDFVAAGVALVQERGFAQLTSRNLGEAMGVHSTAIYRHFPQWEFLVMAVTDALVGEMVHTYGPELASTTDPRERILGVVSLVRQEAFRNPEFMGNLLQIAATPTTLPTPNLDTLVRVVTASLEELGLHGRSLAVALQALESFTVGFLAQEFVGHPDHLTNRLGRRRMVGVPDLTAHAQSTADIASINESAFWLSAHAVLQACLSLADAEPVSVADASRES